MEVIIFDQYDRNHFQAFVDLKQKLQGNLETYFPESISDYEKFFGPKTSFMQDYQWKGILIKRNGEFVAKAILSWRQGAKVGNLGFLDWVESEEVALVLGKTARDLAQSVDLRELKTPVDLNFFIRYRIKLPGGGHSLFGEPEYPDYYHKLFQAAGFKVIGTWDTYRVNKSHIIRSFTRKRKQLKMRRHPFEAELKVRSISLKHWDRDLAIVYDLFVRSFENMPEFEPITLEQFKLVYDDFRYIIHPWYSYIVELQGRPVGFSINYPDPLPVLKKVKGKKLNWAQKLWLLLRLRTNFKTLMMAYVGKIPGPNGEEIKGIQIKTSKQLSARGFIFREGLVCYQSSDSPSRRPIDPESIIPFSQYVLYGCNLEG